MSSEKQEKKKEKKSAVKFPWTKAALFLVVVSVLGVGGLAIAGLFLSLWTIIPAAVVVIGIDMGIKAIYEYQQRQSVPQTNLNPDSKSKFEKGFKTIYTIHEERKSPQTKLRDADEFTSQRKVPLSKKTIERQNKMKRKLLT